MEKEKILVVNGDVKVREALTHYLSFDYDITTTPSFEQALQMFQTKDFHVVITELDSPETKGIEVLSKFKEIETDVTVIVVTNYGSVSLAVEAMKAGGVHVCEDLGTLGELCAKVFD